MAFQQHRLGDNLDNFVTRTAQISRKHTRNLLERVLRAARNPEQGALGNLAGEGNDQNREQGQIDFTHRRLIRVLRQIALGIINLGAHILKGLGGVEPRFEFKQHKAAALECGGSHLLHIRDRFQLCFHRTQQQTLGILRADPALGQLHIDNRHLDVGFCFFRDRLIGGEPGNQKKNQQSECQPCMGDRIIDQGFHRVVPLSLQWAYEILAGTASTVWPSFTKS